MFRRFKKGVIAGTIFTAMSNMHACTYGPPPDSVVPSSEIKVYDNFQNESSEITTDETTTTTTTTTTAAKKTTTETEFDPNDNLNEDVYGPPEWFDDSSEEEPAETTAAKPKTTTTAKTTKDTDYDPDDNMNECVYGPPEWFDDSSEAETTTTVKKKKTTTTTTTAATTTTAKVTVDTDFKPDDNMNVCVYGPPEWFDNSSEGK